MEYQDEIVFANSRVDVWQVVLNEYSAPANIPIDVAHKKLYESNSKVMETL